MKIARFFAGIFAVIGSLLLVGSVGLCLFSLNAPARIEEIPEGALLCAEAVSDSIDSRDYAALEDCLYGQPELGLSGEPQEELTRMVWELAQENLCISWQGDCYMKDAAVCRDAVVTYLETASVTEGIPARAYALLTQRVEEATDMEQLYDETGEFREELMDEILKTAVTQACQEDAKTSTVEVSLEFVHRDGQWWAVPEQALMMALSGGLA